MSRIRTCGFSATAARTWAWVETNRHEESFEIEFMRVLALVLSHCAAEA
jgi:hypothetical protein